MTRVGIRRRLALAFQQVDENPPRPSLWRRMAELSHLAEPLRRPFRNVRVTTSENPQVVMLLPGFAIGPKHMRFMAQQLERAGHIVKQWGLGRNWGPNAQNMEILEQRISSLYTNNQKPIVLIGWSLGGLFARELAHRHPDRIAKVITMGSPFSGNPRANHAWRLYQLMSGHKVDDLPIPTKFRDKPPVETIALWSPIDGVVSPECSMGQPNERDSEISVNCTHMDFASSAISIEAVLEELEGAKKN